MKQNQRHLKYGRIKRTRPINFKFNNKNFQGFEGDTLASALLANGLKVVQKSFKYHRPRNIVGIWGEEPNAIVEIERENMTTPNLRATQVEIYEGLIARSHWGWPTEKFDLLSILGFFSPLFPAGFYYKTFMWPRFMWKRYEKVIRNMTGLGDAPSGPDIDEYEKINIHCDVLIVGGGPTGLIAAKAAGQSGARVILVDEQYEFGGSLLYENRVISGLPGTKWVKSILDEFKRMPNMKLLIRSTVTGYYDHNFLVIHERCLDHLESRPDFSPRERLWRVRAKQVILAAGAIERPLVFSNNDRPGVMLASAVSSYLMRYGVTCGRRILIFTNNDSAYRTALQLIDAEVELVGVVDVRPNPQGDLVKKVRAHGVNIFNQHSVIDVRYVRGQIQSALLGKLSKSFDKILTHKGEIRCDTVAVSGGWNPTVHLHAQSGGKPIYSSSCASMIPGPGFQAQISSGSCNGTFELRDCLREGLEAGVTATKEAGFDIQTEVDVPTVDQYTEEPLQPIWVIPNHLQEGRGGKKFLDYQNDTTVGDLLLAVREGYTSVEHVKRYTALGFGTDQGKLGNINGMALLAQALGRSPGEVGTTTYRPNYSPVSFGAIAGRKTGERFFDVTRKTALHECHQSLGALFEDVGQWKRPWYYPNVGESMFEAVKRECKTARNRVALLDASTLGKIHISGPDSVTLLNWIYTNSWDSLKVGRCRYGIMLTEDGMVLDDGVTSRLSEHQYLMNTTTGNAARVLAWMEQWIQTEWPELQVYLTSVTDHWTVINLTGPNSRKVLSKVSSDIDLADEKFPFMSLKKGTVSGIPARVFRISFSGERTYEINVSSNYGPLLWESLMEAGKEFQIEPYGTETMHVLRAEKGYIIVGQDTDGSVTPIDLGMENMISEKKDFIGKRSLTRPEILKQNRKQLVGLMPLDSNKVLPEGAQLVEQPSTIRPVKMIGHVTSSYFSPALDRSIALGLVRAGRSLTGKVIYAQLLNGEVFPVEIRSPVFFDPENRRQKNP